MGTHGLAQHGVHGAFAQGILLGPIWGASDGPRITQMST